MVFIWDTAAVQADPVGTGHWGRCMLSVATMVTMYESSPHEPVQYGALQQVSWMGQLGQWPSVEGT